MPDAAFFDDGSLSVEEIEQLLESRYAVQWMLLQPVQTLTHGNGF